MRRRGKRWSLRFRAPAQCRAKIRAPQDPVGRKLLPLETASRAADFRVPGHVFPIGARPWGVLERRRERTQPDRQAMGFTTISLVKAWGENWMQTKPGLVSFLSGWGMTPRVGRVPGVLNAWYRDEVLQTGVPLTSALIGAV